MYIVEICRKGRNKQYKYKTRTWAKKKLLSLIKQYDNEPNTQVFHCITGSEFIPFIYENGQWTSNPENHEDFWR